MDDRIGTKIDSHFRHLGLATLVRSVRSPTLIPDGMSGSDILDGQEFLDFVYKYRTQRKVGFPGVYLFSRSRLVKEIDSLLPKGLKWSENPTDGVHDFLKGDGGLTIRLTRIHEYHKNVDALRRAVNRACEGDGGINAYYSSPWSGQAIPFHKDPGTQLIFHLKGRKYWYFNKDESEALCLNPGDILLIPLSYLHRAETKDSYSLHLTMMFNPIPEIGVLNFLTDVFKNADISYAERSL